MIKGKLDVIIIKGDTYEKRITLTNIDNTTIEGVYVSCEALDLSQKTTYDNVNSCYVFRLDTTDTSVLKETTATYDITLKLTNDEIYTLLHKGLLKVIPKVNEVDYA